MKKIITVIGARPQFIKAASVSRAFKKYGSVQEYIIHTGQHYDNNMSQTFFEELNIPRPFANLGIGSGGHGIQTGRMMIELEKIFTAEHPDMVLVYGDTNSTLAGALVASKLHLPVAHVEAGLRSYNKTMPEEVNRILTDHISDYLFCPTDVSVENLKQEGITKGVVNIGDVMFDSVLYNFSLADDSRSPMERQMGLKKRRYALVTVHRAENTDNPENLTAIFSALRSVAENHMDVVLPLHPRTEKFVSEYKIETGGIELIPPVSYLDMLVLEKNADVIMTDSGGVQKEAYWFEVPCITLRKETEWVETVSSGWNTLVGADSQLIVDAVRSAKKGELGTRFYGDGNSADAIVDFLIKRDNQLEKEMI